LYPSFQPESGGPNAIPGFSRDGIGRRQKLMVGLNSTSNTPCSAWIPLQLRNQANGMIWIRFLKPGSEQGFWNGLDEMPDGLGDWGSLNSAPRVKCGRISAYFPTVFRPALL